MTYFFGCVAVAVIAFLIGRASKTKTEYVAPSPTYADDEFLKARSRGKERLS